MRHLGQIRSDVENLAALKQTRTEAPRPGLDFATDECRIGRLQMRDQHLGFAAQGAKLLAEFNRMQVFGGDRQIALLVGEGGLDDQVAQIGNADQPTV